MALIGDLLKHTVHTLQQPATLLCAPYPKIGIEIEVENFVTRAKIPSKWKNKEDGSLRNHGQEFVTMGGLVGRDIETAVVEFCEWAQKNKLDIGYPRAGIHIHLDCTDLDWQAGELARAISLYMIIEDAMFGLAGEWRRTCGFCDALSEAQADFVGIGRCLYDQKLSSLQLNTQLLLLNRYTALNLRSLPTYGTVEFRQLETTFDHKRILDWINVIVAIKEGARKMPPNLDWLREFSRLGPQEFVKLWLKPVWSIIEPHFNTGRAWNAIDNAIALMVEGHALSVPGVSWDGAGVPNPFIAKKLALTEDKIAKKDELVPDLKEPVPELAQQGDLLELPVVEPGIDNIGQRLAQELFRGDPLHRDDWLTNHDQERAIERTAIIAVGARREGESIQNWRRRLENAKIVIRQGNQLREQANAQAQINPPLMLRPDRINLAALFLDNNDIDEQT